MKILELHLNNFLSHKNTVINIANVKLAAITGNNGAGKSTILESITYALTGFTRAKTDDSLIRNDSDIMSVKMFFEVDQKKLTINRTKKRGKTCKLQLLDGENDISGNSVAETQRKINTILNANYDTFVNSAFILQDKFDELIKKTPAQKDEILMSFLDIGRYDIYCQSAKDKVKEIETEISFLNGKIDSSQQLIAGNNNLVEDIESTRNSICKLESQLSIKKAELEDIIKQQNEHELAQKRHEQTQSVRDNLTADINAVSNSLLMYNNQLQFTEQEKANKSQWDEFLKQNVSENISKEKNFMEQTKQTGIQHKTTRDIVEKNKDNIDLTKLSLNRLSRERIQEMIVENNGIDIDSLVSNLQNDIDSVNKDIVKCSTILEEIKNRLNTMVNISGKAGECWVCKQKIPQSELNDIIQNLKSTIVINENEFSSLVQKCEDIKKTKGNYESLKIYKEYIKLEQQVLASNTQYLECKKLYSESQSRMLGWQRVETYGKVIETEKQLIEKIERLRKYNKDNPLTITTEDVLMNLKIKRNTLELELNKILYLLDTNKVNLGVFMQKQSDVFNTQKELDNMKNGINTLVIDLGHYKDLVIAFSRKGIPALIIDNSIPLIESEANKLLTKFNSDLKVRFIRDQNKSSSLDIFVEDSEGMRDIGMFSGGEKIRIALALRIALSKLLMLRNDCKIGFLVIDEPSGLDDDGIECLISALKILSEEYSQILVISHIMSLYNSLPQSIMIYKDPIEGSMVTVKV